MPRGWIAHSFSISSELFQWAHILHKGNQISPITWWDKCFKISLVLLWTMIYFQMYFMNILCTIKIYKRPPNFIWTVALIWKRTSSEWKNDVADKDWMQIYTRKTNVMYTKNETLNQKYRHKQVIQTSNKFKTFSLACIERYSCFGTNSQHRVREEDLGKQFLSLQENDSGIQDRLNLYLS